MIIKSIHAGAGLILACALLAAPAPGLATGAISYQCGKLKTVVARYMEEVGQQAAYVQLDIGKQQFKLPQASAASGVRYTDGKTWEWWTKGEEASLTNLAKKHSAFIICKEKTAAK
ncbi:MAG: Membrane-bound lysozyme-inhibitor of c-type lysozyme [Pseudomonadota bacterium]|jgi:membrane-bound inhibitor of C-type lysozyme